MYIVLPLAQETVKRPKRHHEGLTNIRSYVIGQIVEMRVTIPRRVFRHIADQRYTSASRGVSKKIS